MRRITYGMNSTRDYGRERDMSRRYDTRTRSQMYPERYDRRTGAYADNATYTEDETRRMGYQSSRGAGEMMPLTRREADEWVRCMRGSDGSTGGRWTYDETRSFATKRGMKSEEDLVEFYAIMNAMYSDYGEVAKKHGISMPEFFADLAKAFIEDDDAVPDKVAAYYENIVDCE